MVTVMQARVIERLEELWKCSAEPFSDLYILWRDIVDGRAQGLATCRVQYADEPAPDDLSVLVGDCLNDALVSGHELTGLPAYTVFQFNDRAVYYDLANGSFKELWKGE